MRALWFGLGVLVAVGMIHASDARGRFPMVTTCQDCGNPSAEVRRSAYFNRILCRDCYEAERRRSRKEQEMFLLNRMLRLPSREPSGAENG